MPSEISLHKDGSPVFDFMPISNFSKVDNANTMFVIRQYNKLFLYTLFHNECLEAVIELAKYFGYFQHLNNI